MISDFASTEWASTSADDSRTFHRVRALSILRLGFLQQIGAIVLPVNSINADSLIILTHSIPHLIFPGLWERSWEPPFWIWHSQKALKQTTHTENTSTQPMPRRRVLFESCQTNLTLRYCIVSITPLISSSYETRRKVMKLETGKGRQCRPALHRVTARWNNRN